MSDLTRLGDLVENADGVAPFNETTVGADAAGDEPRVRIASDHAMAIAYGDAPVELAVDPAIRRQGHGRQLVQELLESGENRFWAHGDLPAAQALAASAGLVSVRTLLVLRLEFSGPPVPERELAGITLRPFEPADADSVVSVNGRAFASHPEQGTMDRADFDRRTQHDWFDPAGLFVAERDGKIVGFHWTKVDSSTVSEQGPGIGEVYVVGVDPGEQGSGLGTALTARGLRHLYDVGAPVVDLYVEGDNAPALAVYRRLGFTDHARDTLYALPIPIPHPPDPTSGGSSTE